MSIAASCVGVSGPKEAVTEAIACDALWGVVAIDFGETALAVAELLDSTVGLLAAAGASGGFDSGAGTTGWRLTATGAPPDEAAIDCGEFTELEFEGVVAAETGCRAGAAAMLGIPAFAVATVELEMEFPFLSKNAPVEFTNAWSPLPSVTGVMPAVLLAGDELVAVLGVLAGTGDAMAVTEVVGFVFGTLGCTASTGACAVGAEIIGRTGGAEIVGRTAGAGEKMGGETRAGGGADTRGTGAATGLGGAALAGGELFCLLAA